MALSIKNEEADRLARELSTLTGEKLTEAVVNALRFRLDDEKKKSRMLIDARVDEIMAIARHCASLPVLDPRSPDEILGYDENGLPT